MFVETVSAEWVNKEFTLYAVYKKHLHITWDADIAINKEKKPLSENLLVESEWIR